MRHSSERGPSVLKQTVFKLLAFVVAFALVVLIVPGVDSNGAGSILISALVYMVINATAGRLLKFVTTPIAILTLGLSIFAINIGVLLLTDWLVDGIDIHGFWNFILAALILSVVSFVVNYMIRRRRR
jgi:putative membrane protein